MNKFEQGLLHYISQEQLNTIQSKKIGIGGAGGLGSNIAMILVRSGFKQLMVIDKDIIELSNLNRQQYFLNEIGLEKTTTLKNRLLQINPDLNIVIHNKQWLPEEGNLYFNNYDFIIEAFDQAHWKHKFVEYYQNKTETIVSGNGMAGLNEKQPMTVKKINNIYFVGDHSTDTAQGHPPLAPRVTACAAMMAEIVIDITLKIRGHTP